MVSQQVERTYPIEYQGAQATLRVVCEDDVINGYIELNGVVVASNGYPIDQFVLTKAWAVSLAEQNWEALKDTNPELKCSCGEDGYARIDHGLAAGFHCQKCWEKLVTDCRKQSW